MRISKRTAIAALAAVFALCAVLLSVILLLPVTAEGKISAGDLFTDGGDGGKVKYTLAAGDEGSEQKGLMLYTYTAGARADFKPQISGTFSSELKAANENGSAPLEKYSLIFTDAKSSASFAVTVENNSGSQYIYVEYGGEKAAMVYTVVGGNRVLRGYSAQYNAEGVYFSSSAAQPVEISFDPSAMTVSATNELGVQETVWNFKNTYNDGKKLENDLPEFQTYTLSVLFGRIAANGKGGLLVYSFGGYEFGSAVLDDRVTLTADIESKGVAGYEYTVPAASAVNLLGETFSGENITANVYDKDGVSVYSGRAGGTFTPVKTGTYYIYYAFSSGDMAAKTAYTFEVLEEESITAEFSYGGKLPEGSICKGAELYIPAAAVTTNLTNGDFTLPASVAVKKDGEIVHESETGGFTYTFAEEGQYTVEYTSVGVVYPLTEAVSVAVSASGVTIVPEEIASEYALNTEFTASPAAVYTAGGTGTAALTLVFPSGREETSFPVTLSEAGEYTLVNEYVSGEARYTHTQTLQVMETYDGLFSSGDAVYGSMPMNNERSGVLLTLRENQTVTYNKPIDMTSFTFDDSGSPEEKELNPLLLEMFVLPSSLGSSPVEGVYITFTDAEDPSIKMEVRMTYYAASGQPVGYLRTRVASEWVGYSYNYYDCSLRVDSNPVTVYDGNQSSCMLVHNLSQNAQSTSLKLYFDNDDLRLYAKPYVLRGATNNAVKSWCVRDFRSSEGGLSDAEASWTGFLSGKAYVSVSAYGMTDTAQVFISSVGGEDISQGRFVTDETTPEIAIDTNGGQPLPTALCGREYKLFGYTVSDANAVTVEKKVLCNGKEIAIENDCFIPGEPGVYTITYIAKDSFGNTSQDSVSVQAVSYLDDPEVILSASSLSVLYGERVSVPDFYGKGGAGWMEKSVRVLAGGEELPVENGTFYCYYEGTIIIECKVTDYVGNSGIAYLPVLVERTEEPVFDENSIVLPPAFVSGEEYTFEQYAAYVYTGNSSERAEIPAVITVSDAAGERTLTSLSYTPVYGENASTAHITFTFRNGSSEKVVERDVAIAEVSNGYDFMTGLFTVTNAEVSATDSNLSFKAAGGDMQIAFIRKILMKSFTVTLSLDELGAGETVSLILRDTVNADETVEIGISVSSSGSVSYTVNGNAAQVSPISRADHIVLSYSNERLTLSDAGGSVIYTFGSGFGGFSSGYAYLSLSVSNAQKDSVVKLEQLMNQMMNSNRDRTDPTIDLAEDLEVYYVLGDAVSVPSAVAYDVLHGVSGVTVSVSAPDGSSVLTGADASSPGTFNADQIGRYVLTYTAEDAAGNRATVNKYITVTAGVDPELNIAVSQIKESYSAGDTFAIPRYSVANAELFGEITVSVYLCAPDGLYTPAEAGSEVKLADRGSYTLIYFVYEESGATNLYTFQFTVI